MSPAHDSPDTYRPSEDDAETQVTGSADTVKMPPGAHPDDAGSHFTRRRRFAVIPAVGPGTELNGRYRFRLERRLGKGTFGSVFYSTCLDADPGSPESPPEHVAVKMFHSPEGGDPATMLKRELTSLLALRHDRIPRVYDWDVDGPMAFVAVQYYPSGSLMDVLELMGRLDTASVCRLLSDLLSALTAAHRACVLHLDVKPGNVLLDGNGGYVLTDFGISQGSLVSHSIVPTGLGAPAFQAPEQRRADHDAMDARTDLWGVGVTAWSLYTGVHLWERHELVLPAEPANPCGLPPVSSFRPDCPPDVEGIIMSLVANDPSDRPASAAEVLARVQAVAADDRFESDEHGGATPRGVIDEKTAKQLVDSLLDPLWSSICGQPGFHKYFVLFADGDTLCREREKSYHTFVLLKGKVRVEREGRLLTTETREGTFLGEVTTLTGTSRTATLRAEGPVWAVVLNAAELEKFVTCNPAVGIRLIKSLAERVARESERETPA